MEARALVKVEVVVVEQAKAWVEIVFARNAVTLNNTREADPAMVRNAPNAIQH